jgi:hypothetical protein
MLIFVRTNMLPMSQCFSIEAAFNNGRWAIFRKHISVSLLPYQLSTIIVIADSLSSHLVSPKNTHDNFHVDQHEKKCQEQSCKTTLAELMSYSK